jgi:hypothetical protein
MVTGNYLRGEEIKSALSCTFKPEMKSLTLHYAKCCCEPYEADVQWSPPSVHVTTSNHSSQGSPSPSPHSTVPFRWNCKNGLYPRNQLHAAHKISGAYLFWDITPCRQLTVNRRWSLKLVVREASQQFLENVKPSLCLSTMSRRHMEVSGVTASHIHRAGSSSGDDLHFREVLCSNLGVGHLQSWPRISVAFFGSAIQTFV